MSTTPKSNLPRLLIIDDEPGICVAISLLLREMFQVDIAETAGDALAKCADNYAVILLDLLIPGVAGYSLLENIRQRTPATPIIICSAVCDCHMQENVRQAGAMGMIEKPFSRQELLQKIDQVLGGALLKEQLTEIN